jgi:hypothetical protein
LEEGRHSLAVTDDLSEVGEGAAEVAAGRSIRPIRPEQRGQRITPVWPISFYYQVGQQRSDLVRGKTNNRLLSQGNLKGSQQVHGQTSHGSHPKRERLL